jgi:hypothetical protein
MKPDFNLNDERIEISLSKRKMILLLTGSLIFVALGAYFITDSSTFTNGEYRRYPLWLILAVGYASVSFFGICAIFICYKFFDNKPGLIVDKNGITDNSSGVSVGLIKWHEIVKLSVSEVYRQKFILIYVNDPETIINNQSNLFKRKTLSINNKIYHTPIAISSNALKCNFDNLYLLLTEKFRNH